MSGIKIKDKTIDLRPQFAPGTRTAIRGKDVSALLFDLLTVASPSGNEALIEPILFRVLQQYNKRFKLETEHKKFHKDATGNIFFKIGEKPETMFSSHLDTVHSSTHPLILRVTAGGKPDENGMLYALTREKDKKDANTYWDYPSILGADDKVGVYIMCHMLLQDIPGLYIFHTGEESGGIGSRHIADKNKKILNGIKRAVAFDRAGYDDVICFQRGDRCCSKEFGEALANAINKELTSAKKYKGEARGTFTDTANYTKIIPECTNISVGYFNQHGSTEHLDVIFLQQILLPAILKIDWNSLPTVRDPHKVEPTYNYGYGSGYGWPNHNLPAIVSCKTLLECIVETLKLSGKFKHGDDAYRKNFHGLPLKIENCIKDLKPYQYYAFAQDVAKIIEALAKNEDKQFQAWKTIADKTDTIIVKETGEKLKDDPINTSDQHLAHAQEALDVIETEEKKDNKFVVKSTKMGVEYLIEAYRKAYTMNGKNPTMDGLVKQWEASQYVNENNMLVLMLKALAMKSTKATLTKRLIKAINRNVDWVCNNIDEEGFDPVALQRDIKKQERGVALEKTIH